MQDDSDTTNLAYNFVTHAYYWGLERLGAVEQRIDRLLLFISTISVAIPVATMAIAGNNRPLKGVDWFEFPHVLAVVAVLLFVLSTAIGLCARVTGKYTLVGLGDLLNMDVKSVHAFQVEAVQGAGEDLDRNLRLIERKAQAADVMSALLAVEILVWLAWAYQVLR